MSWMFREVDEGARFPRGYRPVYRRPERLVTVASPFGLHWVVRLGYRLWIWTWRWKHTEAEMRVWRAYFAGLEAGRKETRSIEEVADDAYQRGYNAHASLLALLIDEKYGPAR